MRLKIAELIGEVSGHQPTTADLDQVTKLEKRARELSRTKNVEEYWRITHELHQIVTRTIGNSALRAVYDLFYYQTARIWFGYIQENWEEELGALQSELAEMLRVMRAGDIRGMGFVQRNYIATRLNRIANRFTDEK
jgi:DNA-binding FadR family transcriptional regulator